MDGVEEGGPRLPPAVVDPGLELVEIEACCSWAEADVRQATLVDPGLEGALLDRPELGELVVGDEAVLGARHSVSMSTHLTTGKAIAK